MTEDELEMMLERLDQLEDMIMIQNVLLEQMNIDLKIVGKGFESVCDIMVKLASEDVYQDDLEKDDLK